MEQFVRFLVICQNTTEEDRTRSTIDGYTTKLIVVMMRLD